MLKGVSSAGRLAVAAMLAVSAAGCGQVGALKGKLAFRQANAMYKAGNYEAAARKYTEALEQGCSAAGECNPKELAYSYFFLASSYDNQFRPAKKGDPKNDANLTKAVQYYEEASTKVPDETFRKRALQYMVAVFGAEKLNDPAKAEPVIKRLIELDPNDVANYYGMSRLYEDAGDYANAEAQLLKARDLRPDDPETYGQLARFYEARGQFDKQIEAMVIRTQKEPNSPEAQYRIAVAYWTKTCVPPRPQCAAIAAPANLRAKYVQAGLAASEKALEMRKDYIEALAYKNLLLRSQAWLEPARSDALIKQANELVDQIGEIRKRQQSGETAKPGETAKAGK